MHCIADMDASPRKRRETPDFYGYIPPTGRGLIFLLMTINSTSQFLARILSIALLGAISTVWLLAYVIADNALFLIFKILQNDIFWFVPIQSYVGSVAYGLLTRVWMKVSLSNERERWGSRRLIIDSLTLHTYRSFTTIQP